MLKMRPSEQCTREQTEPFVALPVVIKGDVVSFALPSISGVVEVVFTAAVGTRQETLQSEKAPKL